jgi:hypothetical protein
MNRCNWCSSARGASSSVWRCARYSVRAVMHAAVCGSVLGSVWQCARQCAAVRQCGSVRQCAQLCVAVRAAVCGSALGSVWQCALHIIMHTVVHNIYIGMPL